MPLLTITSNISLDHESTQRLASQASAHVAGLLGKPESYVMVHITTDAIMSFAGDDAPCAMLNLKSLGLPEDRTSEYSDSLCTFVENEMGIPGGRVYIEFASPPRHMWGWDNRTF